MNEEIPYNPPGLDEYIREGARKNSALLRKMQGQPAVSETAEAKPDCAPRTGSAATDELEKACMTLLVGDFYCDTSHLKARIYSILSERGLMDINQHGQMIIVPPNH